MPPTPMTRLRSATETVVPTTCSMIAVSDVMREAISDGRFSSKKPGARRSRLRCTAWRMSASVRSPSQLPQQKGKGVARGGARKEWQDERREREAGGKNG